jgi:hypothetical protein
LQSSLQGKTVSLENACISMSDLLNGFGFGFQEFFGFEIVDRFSMAATGDVVMMKSLMRCEESVFKLEKRCIQSFDPSSSLTVLEI